MMLVDYYRMECVTVACPACGAVRGERCKGKNVEYYSGSGHSDRKVAFRRWAKRHPDAYSQLRAQIKEQAAVVPDHSQLYMGEN